MAPAAAQGAVIPAFERPPADDEELWYLVQALWGYEIPTRAVCPGHVAPFCAFADAFFGRNEMSVWHASRGLGGKSTLLALLGLTEQVVYGIDVTILGGSLVQSQRVHETMTKAWDWPAAPTDLLLTDPTKTTTRLRNGGQATALTASQTSVRGPHPVRLRLDECDEMDLAIFNAALGQPMGAKGVPPHVVMASTWHHPNGTMTEIMRRGDEVRWERGGWALNEWCYRESMAEGGWLTADEMARARRRVPSNMWLAEYELQRPAEESLAVLPDAVARAFDPLLGTCEGKENVTYEFLAPEPGAEYAHGCDWAKELDWTIIVTYRTDVMPWRLVAWERRGRRPWPEMVGCFDRRVQRYGGPACHDITGIGNVIDDYLAVPAEGVHMSGQTRTDLFNDYIVALEADKLRGGRISWAYAEHRWCRRQDLFGTGHPPDSFVAGAMAWYAGKQGVSQVLRLRY